jgi:hypothetical protein
MKEQNARTPPRVWAEVEGRTSLPSDDFADTVPLATFGGYLSAMLNSPTRTNNALAAPEKSAHTLASVSESGE